MLFGILKKIKILGVKNCIFLVIKKIIPSHIKNLNEIYEYLIGKYGLEIGGPSWAFTKYGYIPIYKKINTLDGVNFSSSTIWTGDIQSEHGYVVNKKRVGKLYIADTVDLSIIPNDTYDFILSSNNIEHLANPLKAVEQWLLKLKLGGVLIIVAPKKEKNFDRNRSVVKFEHILDDYNKKIDEHDLTHLDEILSLHDLSMDPLAGSFDEFKERSLKNHENRCLHHHVFDLIVLEEIGNYFGLEVLHKEEKKDDYIIVVQKK